MWLGRLWSPKWPKKNVATHRRRFPVWHQIWGSPCLAKNFLLGASSYFCPVVSGLTLLVPIVTSYTKTWAISVEPWWKIAHKISHSHPKPSFGELKFIKDHWHHWAGWPMVGVSLGLTTCIATFLISWGHIFLLKSPFFGGSISIWLRFKCFNAPKPWVSQALQRSGKQKMWPSTLFGEIYIYIYGAYVYIYMRLKQIHSN